MEAGAGAFYKQRGGLQVESKKYNFILLSVNQRKTNNNKKKNQDFFF